jgi:ABC-2 type transport system permease protein
MDKFWRIFTHEYTRHVLRKRFILVLLSIPAWILFSFAMGILSVVLTMNNAPVGYVDQAGVISIKSLPSTTGGTGLFRDLEFIPYPTEADARGALEAKTIQAFFVLPKDYRQGGTVKEVYLKAPSGDMVNQFRSLLRYNLLSTQPNDIATRVWDGASMTIEATQEDRNMSENDWFKIVAPLAAGIFLIISVFTSSGYLMQAVVEEKENRTMEILVTSASPGTIMGSKIVALIAVGLTQVLVWSFFPLLIVAVLGAYTPFLAGVSIDWRIIALIFLTALPTFVLISALMATIGATATEAREAQQVTSLVTLPAMIPYMLMAVIIQNPNGVLPMVLSFFPLTASLTLLMRMAFATVPLWQVFLSTGLIILSAAGSLWLSGRVFRMGMLRYGKRMGWKDIIAAIFPRFADRRKLAQNSSTGGGRQGGGRQGGGQ